MSQFKNITKHLASLQEEYEELIEFRETYTKTQIEVVSLIKKLFEEPLLKKSKNAKKFREEYYDKILSFFKKENYTQLMVETHIPGIYDPPGIRSKKLPTIKKETKTPPNKSISTPVKTLSKIKPKIQTDMIKTEQKLPTKKKKSTCLLSDSEDEEEEDINKSSLKKLEVVNKKPQIQTNIINTEQKPPTKKKSTCLLSDSEADEEDKEINKSSLKKLEVTNNKKKPQKSRESSINLQIHDSVDIHEPKLYKLELGNKIETSYNYYFCKESSKIYRDGPDLPEGIGNLEGYFDIEKGILNLDNKQIKV